MAYVGTFYALAMSWPFTLLNCFLAAYCEGQHPLNRASPLYNTCLVAHPFCASFVISGLESIPTADQHLLHSEVMETLQFHQWREGHTLEQVACFSRALPDLNVSMQHLCAPSRQT